MQPWRPLTGPDEVPSLLDSEGYFPSSVRAVAKSASIDEVESELRTQIQTAINAGIRISHLDHHMWVMFSRPDLLRLYVQLGIDFNLPVRFSVEGMDSLVNRFGEDVAIEYKRQLSILSDAGLPVLHRIEAANYSVSPNEKREYHLDSLRNCQPGVAEIVIHCSGDAQDGIVPPHMTHRIADRELFSSSEFATELKRLRVTPINWQQFRMLSRKL